MGYSALQQQCLAELGVTVWSAHATQPARAAVQLSVTADASCSGIARDVARCIGATVMPGNQAGLGLSDETGALSLPAVAALQAAWQLKAQAWQSIKAFLAQRRE